MFAHRQSPMSRTVAVSTAGLIAVSLGMMFHPQGLAQTATTSVSVTFQPSVPATPATPAPATARGVVSGVVTPATGSAPTSGNASTAAASKPSKPGELPGEVFVPLSPEQQNKKNERLQKIRQLTFDRRPSATLKAWSTPEDVAIKEAETGGQPGANMSGGPMGMAGQVASPRPRRVISPNGEVQMISPAGVGAGPNQGVPADANAAQPDTFDKDLRIVQRRVTLGEWAAVKKSLRAFASDEAKALYDQMLQALANSPFGPNPMQMPNMNMGFNPMGGMMVPPQPGQMMERNVYTNGDILALAGLSPSTLEARNVTLIGQLLRQAIEQGNAVEDFSARAKAGLAPSGGGVLDARQAAKVLMAADQAIEAGTFLPTPEKAEADNDREALNLLARHFLAIHTRDKKAAQLEQAWKVTQAVLADGKVDKEQKDEAIRRAVDLTPKLHQELGRKWLEESFTRQPERGMEVIAAIGTAAAQGLQMRGFDVDYRLKSLELQSLAVEALLKTAAGRAKDWRSQLALLASSWLKEAEFSQKYDNSTSLGPRMQYDQFGNVFYMNYDNQQEMMWQQRGNMPRPIRIGDIIKTMPGNTWMSSLDEGMSPKFSTLSAQLYLKVNEESKAFPYIERLSKTHTRQARELVEEFLRVWTTNHDPNSQRLRRNPFFYYYGFEPRAESIPLTRSKQERNIKELAEWVKKLKALPVGDIDESLLAKAFTASHSTAEVYRLDAIENVFGALDILKPKTLAGLVQQMRENLAGVWRQPAVQEQNKTKRREKDIRAEVLRGYEVARAVIEKATKQYPDSWELALAGSAIQHDEINYNQQLEKSADFSPKRKAAFAAFAKAAALYAKALPNLPEEEQGTQVHELWYNAALGACDLKDVSEDKLGDARQNPLIRQAILDLKGEAAERHMSRFANTLFTRMGSVKPAIKYRFLKAGLEIVGDHPQAMDARNVFDYYKDLVTEIKLESVIDGADVVGHEQPFGVFVNLVHTREIERESGGFGRYLQNQNTGNNYYYNYGRPLENYRDKFQDVVKKAVEEHFEVISVTFQDEKVNSRATSQYGWRYTPYAYLLLKARSPKVDKIPPLRLDLDFLDTSGFAILPIESATVPIDAAPARSAVPPRPFEKLQITQTLDERQAKDGKLIVEVKAAGRGLLPEIDQLLDIKPGEFEVDKIEDQGLSVSRFDPDSEANQIDSDRSWLVHLKAAPGLAKRPEKFQFAAVKPQGAEVVHQRYVDADLAKVGPTVSLEEKYESPTPWRQYLGPILLGAFGLIVLAGVVWKLLTRPRKKAADVYQMPETITPFSVLGLLRDIERRNGLPEPQMKELAGSIQRLERHYFSESNGDTIDLNQLAENWIRRAS